MNDQIEPFRTSMPSRIKTVVAITGLQAGLGALSTVLLLVAVNNEIDRGSVENEGTLRALVYFSFLLAAVLAACAYLITRRYRWVRTATICVQGLGITIGILNLLGGGLGAVIGIGISIFVIISLNHEESKAWFTG